MIRTQIYLTDRQRLELTAISQTFGKNKVNLYERPLTVSSPKWGTVGGKLYYGRLPESGKTAWIFLTLRQCGLNGTGTNYGRITSSWHRRTDILIDFLRGYSKAVNFVNANSSRIILSSIVVAELYAGVKGESELKVLENFYLSLPGSPCNFWNRQDWGTL